MQKDKELSEEQELSENQIAFNSSQKAIDRLKSGEYPTGKPLPVIEKTPEEQKSFNEKFVKLFD